MYCEGLIWYVVRDLEWGYGGNSEFSFKVVFGKLRRNERIGEFFCFDCVFGGCDCWRNYIYLCGC